MKKIILLLFFVLFFTNSCRNEAGLNDDKETIVPAFQYNYGNDVSRNFFGQVLDRSGNPVSGATISIGSSTVQTTSKGFFMLKNVSVKENFAHIKATKSGFTNAAKVVLPTTGDNRINIMMVPATLTSTINSGATSTVSLPDGSSVKFDGSFKNENGSVYSGSVKVALFSLKTSDTYFNETMPGSFLAADSQGNSKFLESYGMMHVQLTGDAGQNLQIADGHTAEITSVIDAAQLSSVPSTMPLWSYNEAEGIWREDGSANKVGNKYVGTVKHFSWWGCGLSSNATLLQITVTNTSNQPLGNLQITLSTPSTSWEPNAPTNNNGIALGIVPANQPLNMKIYDNCGNLIYTSTIGPFPTNTSTLTVTINSTVAQSTMITGTLLNCAGNSVTDGFVQIFRPTGNNNYFYDLIPVTNGQFSMNSFVCSSSPQFKIVGYDYANLQSTGEIFFTANPTNTNLGFITACNAITESVNYQINNQPLTKCIMGFSTNVYANSLFVNHNPVSPDFRIDQFISFSGVGSYTSGFSLYSDYFPNGISANTPGNNLTLQINNVGPIGGYIDFTISGTFYNGTQTITATGHVIRD